MIPATTFEPSLEELRFLRRLSHAVDDMMEEALKRRENLDQTFRRVLPELMSLTGCAGIAVLTRNELLVDTTWSEGSFAGHYPGRLLMDHPWGVHRVNEGTFISQALDLAGVEVGAIGLFFAQDLSHPEEAARLGRTLETIAEELDAVLATVHTAAEKHQLILQFNEQLSNPVFELGMDQAVSALARRVQLPGFLVVYRDAVRSQVLHYRGYEYGQLSSESGLKPWDALDEFILRHGASLIRPDDEKLRGVMGKDRAVEAVLISGAAHQEPLGKILVWNDGEGFSAFTMDVIRVLASTLTQRLMDYNRERIHLSQFFAASVIDELMKDPRYEARYLTPRDEEVGILFADINSFTRICEMVLETPSRIGRFVDRWSDGVVDILWRHGGVFDKMVGDCVIGLFGPPFFRGGISDRAEAAVRAAKEIQHFTESLSVDPEVSRLAEQVHLPGLGVAVGVNVARTFCGLFGPNQQYTGFSTGMNQTARLQALGGFREILVMESVKLALEKSSTAFARSLTFGAVCEQPVKNVANPLRFYKLAR